MSIACSIDKKRLEYQTLKEMSGISDFVLDTFVGNFLQENGYYPELDQLPRSNSTEYLKKSLDVKSSSNFDYTDTDTILNYTGKENIEEAVPILNNKYKDLEIKVTSLDENSIIEVKRRPSKYIIKEPSGVEVQTDFNKRKSTAVVSKLVNKLNTLYGTQFNVLSTDEINALGIPNAALTKAFVYEGQIYINSDNASIDSPIHEMMHMFLGAMRYTDPDFYIQTISVAQDFPMFDQRTLLYQNRTQMDLLEEVFVEEFGKFLAGEQSLISKLPKPVINKLLYNVNRNLDSVLMGNYSVQSFDQNVINNASLLQLAEMVESEAMNGNVMCLQNLSEISRKMSNLKSALLESGELTENCV